MLIKSRRFISSSKGSLTVQFLLGFVLILSFMVIFGAMTLTLAIASITQYITYASSRALFLSHVYEDKQQEAAEQKWTELKSGNRSVSPPTPGLVKSDGLIDISQVSFKNGEYLNRNFTPAGPNLFYGVWTDFLPKILTVETLWGNTTDKDINFFKTVVGSYLGREPSAEECGKFNENRWEFIKKIHRDIGPASTPIFEYDNGC